jgi:hypothetical protein
MRMPRACDMAVGSVTITGRGFQRSAGSGATVSTASTAPVSSRRAASAVVIPVHCAPGAGGAEAGAQHGLCHAEEGLIAPRGVGGAAVDAAFQRGVVGLDELAGATAGPPVAQARDAAIGAKAGPGCAGQGGSAKARGGVVEHAALR